MKEESRFVVCIDEDFECEPYPKKGDICAIENIRPPSDFNRPFCNEPYYKLKGFDHADGKNEWFSSVCFRPVDTHFGEVVCSWAEETILKQAVLEEAEAC